MLGVQLSEDILHYVLFWDLDEHAVTLFEVKRRDSFR